MSELMRELSRKGSTTNELSLLGGRENTTDLIKKSEKINTLVKEQVVMIKESQEKVQNLVENIAQEEIDLSTVASVKDIVRKSEVLIVLVQVIIKVRNELGHARLDLEKAKKAKNMVKEAKERFYWLEKRLETLLIECHKKASHLLKSTTFGALGGSLANTYLSTEVAQFTPVQCERLFCDVGGYYAGRQEDFHGGKRHCYNVTKNILDNTHKLLHEGDDKKDHLTADESCMEIQTESPHDLKDNEPSDAIDSQIPALPQIEDKRSDKRPASNPPRFSLKEASDTELKISPGENDDEVEKYWKSDHHRFEWPDANVQLRSPLSWHSLGLPVQDSFIAKDRPVFTPDLPWKEKATQVNSVLDIHKIALDKLYTRLHHMYDVIEKATEASINPAPKNDKIEARLRNIESAVNVEKLASKISISPGDIDEKSSDVKDMPQQLQSDTVPIRRMSEQRLVKTPSLIFPRNSNVWCASKTSAGGRVVKKIKTKPPTQQSKSEAILAKKIAESNAASAKQMQKQEAMIWRPSIVYKMVKATKVLKILQAQLQQWDATRRFDQKWKRVQWLLGPNGLLSPTKEIVIEALKTLSELRCSEDEVGTAVETFLHTSKDPRILYEASKALILSGHWHQSAVDILQNALKFGSKTLKQEILDSLCSVDNIPYCDKNADPFQEILNVLEDLVQGSEPSLAFSSALCLGRLFVIHPIAKRYLLQAIKTKSLTSTQKSQAFNVLVRQMNSKDEIIVESLLHELNTSINWKEANISACIWEAFCLLQSKYISAQTIQRDVSVLVRVQACDLLMFIGNRHVLVKNVDEIFEILERLLWDHAHQEVRSKVAELVYTLRLRKKACSLVFRRLDDPQETVRARAIISMATLEMKGEKELKALLDILALDSSVYARIQAVRAFSRLKWNDPRVLRSLKEREKGEGILAREARKALEQLS